MIKTDYKPKKIKNPIFSKKKSSVAPIILISTAILLVLGGISNQLLNEDSTEPTTIVTSESYDDISTEEVVAKKRFELDLNLDTTIDPVSAVKPKASLATQDEPASLSGLSWTSRKIRSGDSTAKLFSRNNLSPTDLYNIMELGKATATLRRIQAGHEFEFAMDATGNLLGIRYHIDKINTLQVLKLDEQWFAETLSKEVDVRLASANGEIESNLFMAGKTAGLTDAMIMELAGIFGWDIDFILDIRVGDRFTLVYEEKFIEGDKYGNGNILAAEFVNQGKSYRAVRYEDSDGSAEYYTPEGLSMRKAFLRAPVNFSYISSKFNPKRFHPILRRVKAHNGVDYRAPRGTPVMAAGDGKVIQSAYNKYNGHYVFIQHGQKYVTKYLHFTKRKVKKGQRVSQGQVIGYVGATGLAEAPHLHYEFLVNGVHRNPRTVNLPDAEPIRNSERQRFFDKTSNLIAQLEKHIQLTNSALALAD